VVALACWYAYPLPNLPGSMMSESSRTVPHEMPIDVISDVVCPWCYIGKRRLEAALAMRPEIAVKVHWRPFFLNPWIPRSGIDRKTYLETKFGSVERYAAMAGRVAKVAAEEGLSYAPDKIVRQPNTLDCHRLILWAGTAGVASQIKQRLMDLYFSEGADLSNAEVLVSAAIECGMDGDLVRRLLSTDADVDRVEAAADTAKRAGINGVPCFILGNAVVVAGAQDPRYIADALERALSAAPDQPVASEKV
jgi:predicted DsbA family dithiol-disulfide isomerase